MNLKKNNRLRMISGIHASKNRIGICDEDYRKILFQETGKSSCRDMIDAELLKVFRRFQQIQGQQTFRKKSQGISTAQIIGKNPGTGTIGDVLRLRAKINALIEHNRLPHAYVNAISRRMFRLDSWRFANSRQCVAIIAALVKKYGDQNG